MATIVGSRSGLFYKTTPGGLPAIVDAKVHTGNVFFVDANAAQGGTTSGFGTHPDSAFTTIDSAINACTANQGDTIYVLPGHTETVANATTIVPDVAGVSIIGLGRGADRPTITFSATGSNIPITAAGVVFENFLFTTTGVIDVTAGITVTAVDVLLKDIEYRESGATSQVVDFIVGAATSARLHVDGLRYLGTAGDAGAAAVSITGAVDGDVIENFNIDGTLSAGCIENVTGVATNMVIRNGLGRNRDATQDGIVVLTTTTTAFVADIYGRAATHDADGFNNQFVGAAAQFYNCLAVNLDGEKGGSPNTASAAA